MIMKITNDIRKNFIKRKLCSDSRWIKKGLLLLFDNQTNSEQASGTTNRLNGVGFTSSDAKILSSFTRQIQRGRSLSVNQERYATGKLPKYWRQILNNSDRYKLDQLILNEIK